MRRGKEGRGERRVQGGEETYQEGRGARVEGRAVGGRFVAQGPGGALAAAIRAGCVPCPLSLAPAAKGRPLPSRLRACPPRAPRACCGVCRQAPAIRLGHPQPQTYLRPLECTPCVCRYETSVYPGLLLLLLSRIIIIFKIISHEGSPYNINWDPYFFSSLHCTKYSLCLDLPELVEFIAYNIL